MVNCHENEITEMHLQISKTPVVSIILSKSDLFAVYLRILKYIADLVPMKLLSFTITLRFPKSYGEF